MRITKTFTLREDTVRKIDAIAKSDRRNKSEIADSLLRRSLGEKQDEIDKIKNIEIQLLELKEMVKKIFNVKD